MEIKEAKKIIFEIVCEIQTLSGRPSPDDFCDDIMPIGDLDGFDSLNAVEVTTQLSEKFECDITGNPFVSGNKPLSIEQIAQKILIKAVKKEHTK